MWDFLKCEILKKRSLQIGEMADFFYCLKYKGDIGML